MFLVDNATLNGQIEDSRFQVAADPGTVIVDERHGDAARQPYRLGQRVDDVLALSPRVYAPPQPAPELHDRSHRLVWIIIANVAAVIVLALFVLWRRRTSPAS
jgi:hypothetical protein